MHTFEFVDEQPIVDVALQILKAQIFAQVPVVEENSHQSSATIQQWTLCYKLSRDQNNDLNKINRPESEGTCVVKGGDISSDQFLKLLKIKKVNIGSLENPKFSNIGDYWDEETIAKITDLRHEYQDIFPSNFSEMKGIVGDIVEMKITLRPDAKPS